MRVRDRSGTVTSSAVVFTVAPAPFRGWIRVSRDDPRYFAFDDGTPYFAVGMNLAEGPIAEYYRWIPRLAKSGGNFTRVWAGHPNFAIEVGRMGEYRLDSAWRLDQILALAEEHGVRLKLCLDWVRHITVGCEAPDGGEDADWQKMNLVWNEIDCVDRSAGGRATLLTWNREMCHHLKTVDPWRHLTTDSLGSTCLWEEMWRMPENEFAQMHGYHYFQLPLPSRGALCRGHPLDRRRIRVGEGDIQPRWTPRPRVAREAFDPSLASE